MTSILNLKDEKLKFNNLQWNKSSECIRGDYLGTDYTFAINSKNYTVMYDGNNLGYNFRFALMTDTMLFGDTGTKDAVKVFGIALETMKDFILTKNPVAISFYSETPIRQKLYYRMLKGYGYQLSKLDYTILHNGNKFSLVKTSTKDNPDFGIYWNEMQVIKKE